MSCLLKRQLGSAEKPPWEPSVEVTNDGFWTVSRDETGVMHNQWRSIGPNGDGLPMHPMDEPITRGNAAGVAMTRLRP